MSADEFGALAALWSSVSTDDEAAALERLAERTPRRARREMIGELVAVGGLALAIGLAMIFRLGLTTLLLGSLLLTLLGWSAWKRHHLGGRALLIDRGSRASFLRSSVVAKEAELKRSALGLAMILPGTFLTLLLMFAIRGDGGGDLFGFLRSLFVTQRGVMTACLLAAAVLVFAGAHRKVRRELERLQALEAEYVEEERRERMPGV